MNEFQRECVERILVNAKDVNLISTARKFMLDSTLPKYSYNFSWLSRPIIQYPQDIVAMQEIIWQVKPDLIIETGIAHGGSLIFSASMLALLDIAEAIATGKDMMNPNRTERKVLGIDIEIRPHNRDAIEAHPMFSRIQMIEGSSIDPNVIEQVRGIAKNTGKFWSVSIPCTRTIMFSPNLKPTRPSSPREVIAWFSIPSSKICPPTPSPIDPGDVAITRKPPCMNTCAVCKRKAALLPTGNLFVSRPIR